MPVVADTLVGFAARVAVALSTGIVAAVCLFLSAKWFIWKWYLKWCRRRAKRELKIQEKVVEKARSIQSVDTIIGLLSDHSSRLRIENASRIDIIFRQLEKYNLKHPSGWKDQNAVVNYYRLLKPHLEIGIQEAQEWKQESFSQETQKQAYPSFLKLPPYASSHRSEEVAMSNASHIFDLTDYHDVELFELGRALNAETVSRGEEGSPLFSSSSPFSNWLRENFSEAVTPSLKPKTRERGSVVSSESHPRSGNYSRPTGGPLTIPVREVRR